MLDEISFEILNGFINMIIVNVAQRYIDKLKNDKKAPPQLIENYLDSSILLLKKYKKIEISIMKDVIDNINEEEQKKFNKLFEEDKEYEALCKELNFAFLLMIDEKLQLKTLSLISDNIYEYKFLVNQEIITKKQINIDKVMEKSDKRKINRLRIYNNLNQSAFLSPQY